LISEIKSNSQIAASELNAFLFALFHLIGNCQLQVVHQTFAKAVLPRLHFCALKIQEAITTALLTTSHLNHLHIQVRGYPLRPAQV
jgi:hypothetical protein